MIRTNNEKDILTCNIIYIEVYIYIDVRVLSTQWISELLKHSFALLYGKYYVISILSCKVALFSIWSICYIHIYSHNNNNNSNSKIDSQSEWKCVYLFTYYLMI
jgi:hypothetical protein